MGIFSGPHNQDVHPEARKRFLQMHQVCVSHWIEQAPSFTQYLVLYKPSPHICNYMNLV